jgi:hypothetical protein
MTGRDVLYMLAALAALLLAMAAPPSSSPCHENARGVEICDHTVEEWAAQNNYFATVRAAGEDDQERSDQDLKK